MRLEAWPAREWVRARRASRAMDQPRRVPRGSTSGWRLLGAVLIACAAVVAGPVSRSAAQTPVPGTVMQLSDVLAREGTYVSTRLSAEVPFEVESRLQR